MAADSLADQGRLAHSTLVGGLSEGRLFVVVKPDCHPPLPSSWKSTGERRSKRWVIATRSGGRETHLLKATQIYARVEGEHLRAALANLGPLLPEEKYVSPDCVTRSLPAEKRSAKPSSKMTDGMLPGIGGEGGIRTLGPGLPRTTA